MTNQPKTFNDISLHALSLAIDLRNIARQHPDAEWTDYPGDLACRTWTVGELIERVEAVHLVMAFIAETPNGYINREALDGLLEQLKVPAEYLESAEAKAALEESSRQFLDGGPDPKQQRDRLHKAAPKLLTACKLALAALEDAMEAEDPQARTQIGWEGEPMATLRTVIAEAEGTGA